MSVHHHKKRYCKHIILIRLILYIPKVLWQGQQVTQAKIWNTTGSGYIQVIHLSKQLSRQVSVVIDQWMVSHQTRLGQPHHYKKTTTIKSVQQTNLTSHCFVINILMLNTEVTTTKLQK